MKKQKKFVITMIIFLGILSLGNKIVLANSEDYAKMIEQLMVGIFFMYVLFIFIFGMIKCLI